MHRFRRSAKALGAIAVVIALLLAAGPAAAQVGAQPPSAPAGAPVRVSVSCAWFFDPSVPVELTATGGSVGAVAPMGSFFNYANNLSVPWSAQPGPATLSSRCGGPLLSSTFTVLPPAVPPAPADVTVAPGDNHVGVSWSPPPDGENVWHYAVVTTRSGLFHSWVVVPGDLTALAVPVPNGENVSVFVLAINRYGAGPFAGPVAGAAVADGPDLLPPTVTTINVVHHSAGLGINWAPVSDPHRTPAVAHRIAAVREADGVEVASRFVAADLRHASIPSPPADSYELVVEPLDVAGVGVADSEVGVLSGGLPGQDFGPNLPQDISIQHGPAGLSVHWRPAVEGGTPTLGYSVAARRVSDGQVLGWRVVGPHDRSATFADLHLPLPRLTIEVYGFSAGAFGPPRTAPTGG